MKFEVHPLAPNGPSVVDGHEDTGFMGFAGRLGTAPEGAVMFIAVLVGLADGCAPPGGADPGVMLRIVGGAAVEPLPSASPGGQPDPVTVADGQGTAMAFATLRKLDRGVYRVRVVLTDEGTAADPRWELLIANRDSGERRFTWVVADSEEEAKKPWIDLQGAPPITVSTGDVVTVSATVFNRGTGELRVTAPDNPHLNAQFEVLPLPQPIPPNGCGDVQFRFTAPSAPGDSSAVYTANSNDPNEDVGGHQRRVSLHATTRSRDVEVAVLGLEPQQTLAYENSLRGQHFVTAMSAVMEPVNRLGTLVFAPDATDPKPSAALHQLAGGVTARFPDFGLLTVVSYLTEQGDPAAGTPAVRDARRRALEAATSTAEGTAFGSAAPASLALPKAAFDVARASGVTQPQIMVVELIPPLVIDDVDWNGGPRMSFNISGHNLVLQLGDSVSVSFSATPLHDHVEGPESSGSCTLFGEPTPEQITAILPEFDHEVAIEITVSRNDGVEAFGELEVHLV